MSKIKKRFSLLVIVLVGISFLSTSFPVSFTVSGSEFENPIIERSSILDLSTWRISGEQAQYFIDFSSLPFDWINNIVAEREIIGGHTSILERVNIYVRSYTRSARDHLALLFSIYVIDRWALDDELNIPFEIVSRSRDFIFAVRYGVNDFSDPNDRIYFMLKLAPMDTPIRMRRFITFPPSQRIDYRNTVFAYGVPLNSQIRRIEGVPFFQLREAAEIMGYTVSWNQTTMAITISRGSFSDSFVIYDGMTQDARGIPIRLINGRTYVSSQYFAIILNKHLSLDPRTGNIIMS